MRNFLLATLLLLLTPIITLAQWEIQSSNFQDSLIGLEHIWAVDNNIAWAIAYDDDASPSLTQYFTRTTNGGINWTSDSIDGAYGLMATSIFALNADTAWVLLYNPVTDGGKIFRTNNGGTSWTYQSTAIFSASQGAYPNLIYFWNENEGFCMGDPTDGYFEIYTTINGGNLWSRVDSTSMPALIPGEWGYAGYYSVVENSLWFGTSKGNIYRSDDKGNNWVSVTNPFLISGKVRVIQFKDSMNGIIGDRSSDSFTLYRTTNGGSTWSLLSPIGTVYGRRLVYVPGTAGTLISTSNTSSLSGSSISLDFGNTWTDITGSSGVAFTTLSNFSYQTGWAGLLSEGNFVGGVAKYQIHSYDAGVSQYNEPLSLCEGNHPVSVSISNYGEGILNNVTVNWEVDGVLQPAILCSNPIGAGQSVDINLGYFEFSGGNFTTINIYTTDPNGLPDIDSSNDSITVVINVFPSPVINLGNDTSVCIGEIVTLDAGLFSSYQWSTSTNTSQTELITTSNTALVTVTDSNGCQNSDTIIVTVNSLPNVDLGPDVSFCEGETVLLDAGVFSTFNWTPSNTAQTFLVSTTGTYEVTVTDINGCINSDTVNVTVNSLPVVNLMNDTIEVTDASVQLNAGPGYISYLWSTGQTSQIIFVDNPGGIDTVAVWVEVTNAQGCTGHGNIVIIFITNGIFEIEGISEVNIFPNPTSGLITIDIPEADGLKDINIADLSGKIIYSAQLKGGNTLDLSQLSNGVYLVKVLSNDRYFVGKVFLNR